MPFLMPKDITVNVRGLDQKQVSENRRRYGSNALSKHKRNTFFKQYLSSFGDPIIKILLIALALNIIIAIKNANIYEPLGIAVALFLATFVSTLSEYGSESAFLKMEAASAGITHTVKRGGKLAVIPIEELAVGDIVLLAAGERVPADGIVVEGSVSVDLSSLNGESAEKQRTVTLPSDKWDITDKGQLFRGCVITAGSCVMCVGRTGDDTFYGQVAHEISVKGEVSPLTKRLSKLAKTLGVVGYIAACLVFFADLFNTLIIDNGFEKAAILREITSPTIFSTLLHALTLAITVVVVAVPEGLPMMITVVLSSNMSRLKRDNVLTRKLVGIETAGCINMLFTDKTGTLTEGKLSVIGVYGADGKGTYLTDDMRICLGTNNDSVIIKGRATGGNATDRALLEYVKKCPAVTVRERILFDSAKKYSAVNVGGVWYFKGAPEIFFNKKKCTSLCNLHKTLTAEGNRVIAMAKGSSIDCCEVVGIVSVRDRLRRDAKRSVALVKNAGIRVCMVTGDNIDTAKVIARDCGILEGGEVIDHQKMESMTDDELKAVLPRLQVVARALPTDKSRLTRLSRELGLTCAMTGDGINDAPALRSADVGFAMGSGTEVAKQAGDIVILDDNFSSIAKAVLYGRTIFKSIRKFIVFQLTMNLAAVGVSVIGPFIGIDTPVTVMQMLWINMIMDTLAGLAFAGEAPLLRYMNEKPIPRDAPVLTKRMAARIAVLGGYSVIMCVCFLMGFGGSRMTSFFALFVFAGIFAGIGARTEGMNLLRGLYKNKSFLLIFALISVVQILLLYFGGDLFRGGYIPPGRLINTVALASTVLAVDVISKFLFKNFSKNDS